MTLEHARQVLDWPEYVYATSLALRPQAELQQPQQIRSLMTHCVT
jgi:hypothetical protein